MRPLIYQMSPEPLKKLSICLSTLSFSFPFLFFFSLFLIFFLFRNSEFAVDAFGSDVVHHYARHAQVIILFICFSLFISHFCFLSSLTLFFQLEVENYKSAVTDWELRRYFEQI